MDGWSVSMFYFLSSGRGLCIEVWKRGVGRLLIIFYYEGAMYLHTLSNCAPLCDNKEANTSSWRAARCR